MHGPKRERIFGIGRARPLGGCELGTDVPREIGVGCLPGLGLRVMEDKVSQLAGDLIFWLPVERRDEGQIDRATLVKRDK